MKKLGSWLIEIVGAVALMAWSSLLLRIVLWIAREMGKIDSVLLRIVVWVLIGNIVFWLLFMAVGYLANVVSLLSEKVSMSARGLRHRTIGWFFILYSIICAVSYLKLGTEFWWIVSVSQLLIYSGYKLSYAKEAATSDLSATDKYVIPILISVCLLIGLYGGIVLLAASGFLVGRA